MIINYTRACGMRKRYESQPYDYFDRYLYFETEYYTEAVLYESREQHAPFVLYTEAVGFFLSRGQGTRSARETREYCERRGRLKTTLKIQLITDCRASLSTEILPTLIG